jgi:glutamate dehydrogenase (NAD(P)+)
MACEQFRVIADYLNIDQSDREWATYPNAADRGDIAGAHGRREHPSVSGLPRSTSHRARPTKGGTRFAPSLSMGETAALAMWMSWKCALAQLPYGGAKGRRGGRSNEIIS